MKKKDIESMLNNFTSIVSETLPNNDNVKIKGFGTFIAVNRKERYGINPNTKEKLFIPKSKLPKFRVSSELIDRLK